MLFDSGNLLQVVSENVRRNRAARKWSQSDLGEHSKVSRGMIAKIESGEENVSLATLGRIALAFGITFTELVTEPEGRGSEAPAHRVRVWQGTCPGTRVALLGSFVGQRMTDFFEWTLAPGDRYSGEPDQKDTHELVYVATGTLTLEDGNGVLKLKAGESVVFPSDRQYTFINGGKSVVRFILSVIG